MTEGAGYITRLPISHLQAFTSSQSLFVQMQWQHPERRAGNVENCTVDTQFARVMFLYFRHFRLLILPPPPLGFSLSVGANAPRPTARASVQSAGPDPKGISHVLGRSVAEGVGGNIGGEAVVLRNEALFSKVGEGAVTDCCTTPCTHRAHIVASAPSACVLSAVCLLFGVVRVSIVTAETPPCVLCLRCTTLKQVRERYKVQIKELQNPANFNFAMMRMGTGKGGEPMAVTRCGTMLVKVSACLTCIYLQNRGHGAAILPPTTPPLIASLQPL